MSSNTTKSSDIFNKFCNSPCERYSLRPVLRIIVLNVSIDQKTITLHKKIKLVVKDPYNLNRARQFLARKELKAHK